MNQTICIAYQPGAYGSFVSWAVNRFSAVRKRYQPPIVDDPLLPDGSSHAYASHCKMQTTEDFIDSLEVTRVGTTNWYHSVFAGWPGDINSAVPRISDWMLSFDRLIVIEAATPGQHMLCYLRNEATMDRKRWYGMLGITDDNQLFDRLNSDVNEKRLDRSIIAGDPRISVFTVGDLLEMEPGMLFSRLGDALSWPMCDENLFVPTLTRMRQMQKPYTDRIWQLRKGGGVTPAEKAIERYFKGENKWI